MAHGLVQQYAWPSRSQHHGHGACRGIDGFQIHQSLANRLPGIAQGAVFLQQPGQGATAAPAGSCLLTASILFDDDVHIAQDQGTHVGGEMPLVVHDQNGIVVSNQVDGDLFHPGIRGSGGSVQLLQQIDLAFVGQAFQGIQGRIEWLNCPGAGYGDTAALARMGDGVGAGSGFQQVFQVQVFGVGEAGFLTADGAQPGALLQVEIAFLDDAVIENPGLLAAVLEIQVCGIQPAAHELVHDALKMVIVDASGRQQGLPGQVEGVAHGDGLLGYVQ